MSTIYHPQFILKTITVDIHFGPQFTITNSPLNTMRLMTNPRAQLSEISL